MTDVGLRRGPSGELRKLAAFLRRDWMIQLSYRTAFVGDLLNLAFQAALFYFVQRMVDASTLPVYGGERASYFAFVIVGIAFGAFLQIGLGRTIATIRNEQLLGTLESLFMTPTRPFTIQLGLVVYDLIYVPLRTAVFLLIVSLFFGVDWHLGGIPVTLVLVFTFIPMVWGLGMAGAAVILTFRRGGGLVGLVAAILVVGAGAYFPLSLFPSWVETMAQLNPVAVAFEGARRGLIGGEGWAELLGSILFVAGSAAFFFLGGLWIFGKALARERARGTLSLY